MNDVDIAEKFLRKVHNAHQRGIQFDMTLQSMRNLMRAKKCFYTGFTLTEPEHGQPLRATDRTIDRIDSSKGYVKGNVVACCHAANKLKSMCEGGGLAGYQMGQQVLQKTISRIKKETK